MTEELLRMRKEIEESEGYRIYQKIKSLKHTYYVFTENYQEIKRLLDEYETNTDLALHLMVRDNREEFEAFLVEITRRLHNFLAAVKTLVDHTRAFYQQEYEQTDFAHEYQKELKEQFIEVEAVKFVQDLRNYILHKTLPITGANVSFGRSTGVAHSITLDIVSLRDWDKWTAKSISYMSSVGDTISLNQLIDEYESITDKFYGWFGNRMMDLHKEDLDEMFSLDEQYQDYLKQNGLV